MKPIDIAAVDALLPQTQCTRCGYPTCRDYAEAITRGDASINRCPPGGDDTIRALAALLDLEVLPLDPARGAHKPSEAALIDESACIGCMLCIRACPVDAIVGAAKRMHTVVLAHCTGCELCLPACPVDCIEMLALEALAGAGASGAAVRLTMSGDERARDARARFESRRRRLAREKHDREQRLARKGLAKLATIASEPPGAERDRKKAIIEAALARARQRREREAAARKPKP